jgi:hypothetical protein
VIEPLAPPKLVSQPGMPDVMSHRRARVRCGCAAYVGVRLDNMEAAVAALPCGPGHRRLLEHFQVLFSESLEHPTERDLDEVTNELLERASRELGVAV